MLNESFRSWLGRPSTGRTLDRLLDADPLVTRPCLHIGSGCPEQMVLVETSPNGIQWFRCQAGHDSFVQPSRVQTVSVDEVVERR